MKNAVRNAVMVLCLLALGGFATWLYLRPQIPEGSRFTDGRGALSSRQLREHARLALWDRPVPLPPDFQSLGSVTDPFVEESTGRVYFAAGRPGEDQDLWVAESDAGGAPRFRRLDELGTPFDESSPAHAGGYLYFSSNRSDGHGGHDLWRARARGDAFAEPENLGPAVNTAADEVDPVVRPGLDEVFFASNRDAAVGTADFDLYLTRTDGTRFSEARPLATLDSPYDERAPSFDADGRVLVFASDRAGGAGGYDLYRTIAQADAWIDVQNLTGLNSASDETAPALSDGGFTLYFASDREAGDPTLWVAHTRELYALPGGGLGLLDLTILLLLALVALLAYLARRWSALDLIYKCLLLSLLLHLLVLWLTRRIDIEAESVTPGEGRDAYEVQLLAEVLEQTLSSQDREHGESVEAPSRSLEAAAAERASTSLERPELAAAPQPAMERAAAAAAAESPSRGETRYEPSASAAAAVEVAVELPAESYERLQGEAPELVVEAGSAAATAVAAASAAGATRQAPALAEIATEHQETPGLARAESTATAPAPSTDRVAAASPSSAMTRTDTPTREPTDRVATATSSAAPALQVTHAEVASASPSGAPAVTPDRASLAAAVQASSPPSAAPAASPPLARASEGLPRSVTAAARPPSSENLRPSSSSSPPVELRAPQDATHSTLADASSAAEGSVLLDAPAALPAPSTSAAEPVRSSATTSLPPAASSPGAAPAGEALLARSTGAPSPAPARAASSDLAPSYIAPGVVLATPSARAEAASSGLRGGEAAALEVAPRSLDTAGSATVASAAGPRRAATESLETTDPFPVPRSGTELLARSATAAASPAPQRLALPSPAEVGPSRLEVSDVPLRTVAEASAPRETSGSTARASSPGASFLQPSATAQHASPRVLPGPVRAALSLPAAVLAPVADAAPLEVPVEVARSARTPPATQRPTTLYDRRQGPLREVAVREGGGDERTERAVLAGLRYLASVQRTTGCFGESDDGNAPAKYKDVRAGKTGLACLAFLGAGHTHRSRTEFSGNVENALRWLLREQDRRTGHFGNSDGYGHGIATYALAECYAMTGDRDLLMPLMRAVRHILEMQTRETRNPQLDGGWPYYYTTGRSRNADETAPRTSLSSWQVMALESARAGGLPIPDEALELARSYFENCYDARYGYFRYTHESQWLNGNGYRTLVASTPASMFVLNLLGLTEDPMLDAGARYVLDRLPAGFRYRGQDAFARDGVGNVYFWYYASLAMFLRGGAEWRTWNLAMKDTLVPSQNSDGSWDAIGAYAEDYAGDDSRDLTYTTSMCVLTLEVYYRYFTPLLQRQGR